MSRGLTKLSHVGGAIAAVVFSLAAGCQGSMSDQGEGADAPSFKESDGDSMPDRDDATSDPDPGVGSVAVGEEDLPPIVLAPPEGTGGAGDTGGGLAGSSGMGGMGGESTIDPGSGSGGSVTVDPCDGADMCCGLDDGPYCAVDRATSKDEFSVHCAAGQIAAVVDCVDRCVRNTALCDDKGGGSSGGQKGDPVRPRDSPTQ